MLLSRGRYLHCVRTPWTSFRYHIWPLHHFKLMLGALVQVSDVQSQELPCLPCFVLPFCLCQVLPTSYLFLASTPSSYVPIAVNSAYLEAKLSQVMEMTATVLLTHKTVQLMQQEFISLDSNLSVLSPFLILPRDFLIDVQPRDSGNYSRIPPHHQFYGTLPGGIFFFLRTPENKGNRTLTMKSY